MNKIILFYALALLVCSGAVRAADYDGEKLQQALFASLTLDDDPMKSRLGARAIRKFYADRQELTDLIAEQLMTSTDTEPKSRTFNAVAWYIIALGEIGNPRYRDILTAVRLRTVNKTLVSDIDKALLALRSEAATPYIHGTIDIPSKKVELAHFLAANRTAKRSTFDSISPGTSLVHLLEVFGAPDDMTAWTVRTQKLAVHYSGTGLVLLSIQNEVPYRWVAIHVAAEPLPVREYYSGDRFGFAQILATLHGKMLVQFYKSESRLIRADVEALGLIAYRAIDLPYPTDDYDQAMIAIGLKALARSRDLRGIDLVRKVAAMPKKNDAQKFAQRLVSAYEKRQALGKEAGPQEEEQDSSPDESDIADDSEAQP